MFEADDDSVNAGLQVFLAKAVVDAKQPALEIGNEPVRSQESDICNHGAEGVRAAFDAWGAGVGGPAVWRPSVWRC